MEEVQRLSGRPIARSGSMGGAGASAGSAEGGGLSAEQLLNAGDVINHRLVTFRTLDELVEQNRWVRDLQGPQACAHSTAGLCGFLAQI
jgi:hypothetical protein